MTFAAASVVGDNTLGKYLKIVSQNGVYSQLSEQSIMWKNILKKKKGPAEGRELRYLVRSSYGMAAAQFLSVNGAVEYPSAHQAGISEGTAYYKDFAVTVEVERTLIAKALSDMAKYGEPLAEELKCKTIGLARVLSAAVYQDGTGRIGEVSSAAVVNSTQLEITLKTGTDDIGHVGWFEYGDKVKCVSTAGATQSPTVASGTHAYFTVASVDRINDKVVLNSYDSSGTLLDVDAANQVGSGDYFIRYGTTANDYANISTNDYGLVSEVFVGLHSLTEDDGRKVNGLTLTAPIKGTRFSASGNPVDSQHFQQLLSQVKVAVGEGAYKWKDAIMAPEVLDSLVESRETDRRFMSIQDNKRGVASLGYVHGKDTIMFMTDEYCPKKRIYVVPEGDVLQFRGSDFEFVKPEGGQKFFLRPSNGGHYRSVRAYMEGSGLIMCVHPQAIGVLDNFTF
jgi:hypothetical protein